MNEECLIGSNVASINKDVQNTLICMNGMHVKENTSDHIFVSIFSCMNFNVFIEMDRFVRLWTGQNWNGLHAGCVGRKKEYIGRFWERKRVPLLISKTRILLSSVPIATSLPSYFSTSTDVSQVFEEALMESVTLSFFGSHTFMRPEESMAMSCSEYFLFLFQQTVLILSLCGQRSEVKRFLML